MAQRKLGRGVAIVDAGMSKFGAFPDKTTRDLFVDAFSEMRVAHALTSLGLKEGDRIGCEAFLKLNITPELHRIKTPTLLMVGEQDTLKPRHYADIIAREMPHAEYAIVPGSGHALCWEKWQVFNSLVLGFLARQDKK